MSINLAAKQSLALLESALLKTTDRNSEGFHGKCLSNLVVTGGREVGKPKRTAGFMEIEQQLMDLYEC